MSYETLVMQNVVASIEATDDIPNRPSEGRTERKL